VQFKVYIIIEEDWSLTSSLIRGSRASELEVLVAILTHRYVILRALLSTRGRILLVVACVHAVQCARGSLHSLSVAIEELVHEGVDVDELFVRSSSQSRVGSLLVPCRQHDLFVASGRYWVCNFARSCYLLQNPTLEVLER